MTCADPFLIHKVQKLRPVFFHIILLSRLEVNFEAFIENQPFNKPEELAMREK